MGVCAVALAIAVLAVGIRGRNMAGKKYPKAPKKIFIE